MKNFFRLVAGRRRGDGGGRARCDWLRQSANHGPWYRQGPSCYMWDGSHNCLMYEDKKKMTDNLIALWERFLDVKQKQRIIDLNRNKNRSRNRKTIAKNFPHSLIISLF
jgi:hypothetical protein